MQNTEQKNEALIGGSELNAGLCTLEVTAGVTLSLERYNELLGHEPVVAACPDCNGTGTIGLIWGQPNGCERCHGGKTVFLPRRLVKVHN